MGRKGISYEKKLAAAEKYLRGEGSQKSIAREYRVTRASFSQWLANYEAMGPSGLKNTHTNNKYSVTTRFSGHPKLWE
jgi:transposase